MTSSDISLTDQVCWNAEIPAAELDGAVLALNSTRALFYELDDIGSEIFRRIASPISVSKLCGELAEQYAGEPAAVQPDVLNFLNEMAANGLITVTRGNM